jgi:hypothetical protein
VNLNLINQPLTLSNEVGLIKRSYKNVFPTNSQAFPVAIIVHSMTLESPDPFLLLTRRPSNESPEDEAQRVAREAEAKRINDEIDEALKLERALLKKEKCVRILLLGQSESG